MASFKKTGIEVAAEAKVLTPEEQKGEDEKKAAMGGEDEMKEGGDDAGMPGMEEGKGMEVMMAATVTDPRSAHVDD